MAMKNISVKLFWYILLIGLILLAVGITIRYKQGEAVWNARQKQH